MAISRPWHEHSLRRSRSRKQPRFEPCPGSGKSRPMRNAGLCLCLSGKPGRFCGKRTWMKYSLLEPQQLWEAWEALSQILGRSWRGSMLAECVNSLLRPVLHGRKHTDQGCLKLFRFMHNVHPFERGKRAGHSPAQLVGLAVPDDALTLPGLAPNASSASDDGGPVPVSSLPPAIGIAAPFTLILSCCSLESQKVSI